MDIDVNGRNASIEVPPGYMLMDAILVGRIVNIEDPSDATISIGCTDHTDPIIQCGMLEIFEEHRAVSSFLMDDDDD